FRHPEPDPDEIRARLIDCSDVGGVFLRRERTERRRPVAGDHEARKALLEARDQILADAEASAIKIMSVAPLRPDLAHRHQQIRSGDAPRIGKPSAPAPPDEGHSVLDRQPGSIERASHLGVALGFHQAVYRDAAEVLATALFAPAFEHRNGSSEIDRGY